MRSLALGAALALLLSGCSASHVAAQRTGPSAGASAAASSHGVTHGVDGATASSLVPRFAHIVVVVEENHSYADVIGNADAPYINGLARSGALLTRSYGIRHPSEPNYLALFSGSTHGITDDSCPHTFGSRNLGSQLIAHQLGFTGYAESLPSTGYLGCYAAPYARKHAPWTDFSNLPARVGRPMTAFPTDYRQLSRVAFVVPNLNHDMHDGTVAQGDSWLHQHLAGYVTWARTHNSLLVLTWDEDDSSAGNHIATVFAGAHVRTGRYAEHVDHYTVLRTLEAAYGLPALGTAANRSPITNTWVS